jgi:charged multivesicular body protein 4A/B
VDQVDDTMDEIREQMEVAAEINDAIAQPLGGEMYDEAELEEELAALEEEAMNERFSSVSTVPTTPVANKPVQINCMYFTLFSF